MRLALLLAVVVQLAACGPTAPEAPDNLVVICIDTVRYDSFFAPDINDELTPWLARAQQFPNAQASAPWTLPSVASLFTGRHPVEHGAGRFPNPVANLDTDVPTPLHADETTLAEILDANYFRTGAFVSHPFFLADLGLRQGFQEVHNRRGWWRDVARMWEWVDKFREPSRFFGYLHFMEAHHRHTQSTEELRAHLAEVNGQQLAALRNIHKRNCKKEDSRRCLQALVYEAAVRELRGGVAAVLDDLRERGILDNTLVVLYSDHGEEFWDHEQPQRKRGQDPRQHVGLGHGQSLYQELIRIPLVVWHPGLAGAVHEQPVSHVDVLPSVLRWLEIETPGMTFSGQLLPPFYRLWFGPHKQRPLFASGIAYGPERVSVRVGHDKSIFDIRSDSFRYYDLANDPLEMDPLPDSPLGLEFTTLTGDYLEMSTGRETTAAEISEDRLGELKAIGYLQGVEDKPDDKPQDKTPSAPEETGTDGD